MGSRHTTRPSRIWVFIRDGETLRLELREHRTGSDLLTFRDGECVALNHFFSRDAAVVHADAMLQQMSAEGWRASN